MKEVIFAVIMGLMIAGGIGEARAAACCATPSTGAGIAEGSKGAVSSARDCMTLSEMMENSSETAGHEGTMGPCDVMALGNREAASLHSEPDSAGAATEAPPPAREEYMTVTPYRFPRDGR